MNASFTLASTESPSKTPSQYVHDVWNADNGFLGGAIYAICQSQDGYLWIGTERGLVRFNGFDFTLIQRPVAGMPSIGAVRSLAADVEGNLWIRLDGPRLLLYRDGKFVDAVERFSLHEVAFTAMALDTQGELILWGLKNQTLRYSSGKFRRYAGNANIAGIVISAAETRDHRVWLGTRNIGLFQIDQDRMTGMSNKLALTSVNALLPVNQSSLWIGTDAGLSLWDGTRTAPLQLPSTMNQLQILALASDHSGNVWAGTAHGLVRITPAHAVSTELLNRSEVTCVYEDRDGDLWYGGPHGIERLREGMFTKYTTAQGLPAENNGPIFADAQGRTWFAPQSGGLYWIKDGQTHRVTVDGLDKDVVYSISGGGDEIWLGREHGGLTRLTGSTGSSSNSLIARTWTQADGLAQNSVDSVHRNHDGTVWAATVSGGVGMLKDGSLTNYTVANGQKSNAIFSIVEGHDGTMWFATPNGLESFSQGAWKNYSVSDGLPSSNVRSIFEDFRHILWIATSGGLAYFNAGRVQTPKSLTDPLREEVLGMAEDTSGFLWITTSDHVLRVNLGWTACRLTGGAGCLELWAGGWSSKYRRRAP